jgi:hypothetical protein
VETGGVDTLKKETDDVGLSDAQAKKPSDTDRQTKARRSKPSSRYRPAGQDSTLGKERQTS